MRFQITKQYFILSHFCFNFVFQRLTLRIYKRVGKFFRLVLYIGNSRGDTSEIVFVGTFFVISEYVVNFDYIYFKELGKLWRNGTIYIKRIDDVDNVGAYITKYMTKDNIDERLKGKKCYTMSKGLKTPTVYTNEKKIKKIMESIPEKDIIRTITKEYESEYYGKITYIQIVLKSAPKISQRKRGLLDFTNRRLVRLSDDLPTPFDE